MTMTDADACQTSANHACATPVRAVLSPSLRAHRYRIVWEHRRHEMARPPRRWRFPAGAFFMQSEKAGAIAARRLTNFVATALPNVSIRALKLGDRTIQFDVVR
jgi:hypothetical protein